MSIPNALETWSKRTALFAGFPESVWEGIAVQFAQEKGWSYWDNPSGDNNPANVSNAMGQVISYSSLWVGCAVYIQTLHNGDYQAVLDAGNAGDVEGYLKALSESPWANPKYPLGELQGVLAIIQQSVSQTVVEPPKPAPSVVEPTSYAELIATAPEHLTGAYAEAKMIADELQKIEHPSYYAMLHNPVGGLGRNFINAQQLAVKIFKLTGITG